MAEDRAFLAETETIVPILHPPGSGKVVGVLGGQSTFKVLSEQTGGPMPCWNSRCPEPGAAAACPPPRDRDLLHPGGSVRDHARRSYGRGPSGGAGRRPPRHPAYLPQRRPNSEQAAPDRHPGSIFQLLPRGGRPSRRGPRHHQGPLRQVRRRSPRMNPTRHSASWRNRDRELRRARSSMERFRGPGRRREDHRAGGWGSMMSRRVWSAAVTRRSERSPATRCEAGRSALPAGRSVR